MATFAPEVPQIPDPVYFHWSKPIEQPKADLSGAIKLKTLGEGIKDLSEVADYSMKRGIDNSIHSDVDKIQNEYIDALQGKYRQDTQGGGQLDSNGIPVGPDTLTGGPSTGQGGGSKTDIPVDLKGLNGAVDILGNARANNKLSKTAYDMRMDALAKDYRARYPGYRDYIDETFQRANSVRSTANQYISSLLGDINSFQQAAQSRVNKTEQLLISHFGEIANAPILHEALRTGAKTPLQVEEYMYPYIAEKATFERNKRTLEQYENDKKYQGLQATDILGTHILNDSKQFMDGFEIATDTSFKKSGMSSKLIDVMQGWANGTITPSAQQFDMWATQLEGAKQQLYNKALKEATQPIDPNNPNSKTMVQLLGGQQAFDKVFEENTQLITRYIDAIRNKNSGAMFASARANQALSDGTLNLALRDPKVGGYLSIMKAFEHASPAFLQTLQNSALMRHMAQPDSPFIETLAGRVVTQQDRILHGEDAPVNPTGEAFTMSDAVKILTNPEVRKKLADPAGTLKAVIGLGGRIGDKNIEDAAKAGLSTAAFDPKNQDFLGMFTDKDKYSIFSQLTNPDNTKELFRLGQQNPQMWQSYKNWAETSFARFLYSTELNNIKDYKDVPGVEIHYNDTTNTFSAALSPRPDQKVPADYFARARVAQAKIQERLNFLNQGISSMVNIAKAEGKDPTAYLHQIINLVSPGATDPQNADTASKFNKAIESTKPMQYNDEGGEQHGSLQEFMKNPSGAAKGNTQLVSLENPPPQARGEPIRHAERHANLMHGQFGAPGQNIVSVNTLAGPVSVNRASAPAFQGFINELAQAGAPIKDMGGFNIRNIRGTHHLSQHAYGNAIDIDQQGRDISPAMKRWANANQGKFREILNKYNMISGGDWRNPDFGHFEWAGP